MQDYRYMDNLSEQEVMQFKEQGLEFEESAENQIQLQSDSGKKRIIAEGDSWFNFLPGTDLIDCLRKRKHSIKNYAKAGDTLENMIYGTGRNGFEPATPQAVMVLEKISAIKPNVFLFSGGGNDIAGDEFGSYLNHKDTGLPFLRLDYAKYMIDTFFRKCIEDMIAKVAAASPATHILMHGYAHPKPTGKGVSLLLFNFAGPWLRPALVQKRILDSMEQENIVRTMIDLYNEMLKSVDKANPKFHHIDLRELIDPGNDWRDELHLKNSAYAKSADVISGVIDNFQHGRI